MSSIDGLARALGIKGGAIHAAAESFRATVAPVATSPKQLDAMWLELANRPWNIRAKLRHMAGRKIEAGLGDTADGLRLAQVLSAVAALSGRSQIVLEVSDRFDWSLATPSIALICLPRTKCEQFPKKRKGPPDANGNQPCCEPYAGDIVPGSDWRASVERFVSEHRRDLGLANAKTRIFLNPGELALFATSS